MRWAKITLPKRDYEAGETIEGHVVITCDKEYKANSVTIRFVAREHTKIVVSDGDSSTTYREEEVYCNELTVLKEEGDVYPGEERLPFRFTVPNETPSTYHGTWTNVEYTLEAKIDIPWAFDVVSRGEINVKSFDRPPQSKQVRVMSDKKEYPDLQAEIQTDVVCIGDDLQFKVCVSDERNIRGLRVDVINREWAKAKRVKRDGDHVVLRKFFPVEHFRVNSWINMRLKTGTKVPITFKTPLMSSEVLLKITMDIPWDFDTSIYVPIYTIHCPVIAEDDDSSFDSIF
ncbi:MAG: sporulation protein [Candidatus Thorarchaeota archaeon]|nr:sporulation protein [Candidatus Thorarchaeota archaeon]